MQYENNTLCKTSNYINFYLKIAEIFHGLVVRKKMMGTASSALKVI